MKNATLPGDASQIETVESLSALSIVSNGSAALSLFRGIKPESAGAGTLQDVLAMLTNGQAKKQTIAVRAALAKANGAKKHPTVDQAKKQLPGVTFSGEFTHRANSKLVRHSGLIQGDFDDVKDLDALWDKLKDDPHLAGIFVSPTGTGIKAIFRITVPADMEKAEVVSWHSKQAFPALSDYCYKRTGLAIDGACREVARLCFLGHCDRAFINEDAAPLPIPEPDDLLGVTTPDAGEKPPTEQPRAKNNTLKRQEALAKSARANSFYEWAKKCGFEGDLRTLNLEAVLSEAGMIRRHDANKIHIECPNQHHHTTGDGLKDASVFTKAGEGMGYSFNCFHGHCVDLDIRDLLEHLEARKTGCIDAACSKTFGDEAEAKAAAPSDASIFANFRELFAKGFKQDRPEICQYAEGKHLLYRGRVNEIHGEPGVGKTNINLSLAAEAMRSGERVMYLDPEDTPNGIGSRFVGLGGEEENLFSLFDYAQSPTPADYDFLHAHAIKSGTGLVILDGLAEALAGEGLNEDVHADVLKFFRTRIRPFTAAGIAVLVSDHVTKSADSRGRWARGSGAKMGHYDGAVYEVKLKQSYTPEIDGFVRLVISKDRNGGVGRVHHAVVDLHFKQDDYGRTVTSFEAPVDEIKGKKIPTFIMEKISKFLEDHGPQTKRMLRDLPHDNGTIDRAIIQLMTGNFIKIVPEGQKSMHHLLKPYRNIELGESTDE